ncbi:MAG TPA: FG-GAP repeat protein [Terriglobia bacterium]|nr:FG-GAP repeat protein [Terriglobia bacterium]
MNDRKTFIIAVLALVLCCLSSPGFSDSNAVAPLSSSANSKTAGSSAKSSLPPAARSGVSAVVGHDIPAYAARSQSQGFEITNSGQNLVADFTPAGIEMRGAQGSWGMAMTGYGYAGEITAAGMVAPEARANRVAYERGDLTEWYENGPLGLEQGFTLGARPAHRASGPLTLAFQLSGPLMASVNPGRTGLTLSNGGQAVLEYTGLSARDADGRDLHAWMEMQGSELMLKVNDANARYPLTIDPWVQQAEVTITGPVQNDYVGFSVAVAGSTLVVGAPQATIGSNSYQGAAYVFVKPKTGWANMTETAMLTASDGNALDELGWSVATSGSTIAVGAYGNSNYTGAVYVYVEPKTGWASATQTAKLTASGASQHDFVGYSLSMTGSTIVAGAPNTLISAVNEGAAYVFIEPTGGWQTTSKFAAELTSSDETADCFFGNSVGISGSTVVIGDVYANIGTNVNQGAAYVYVKPTSGWATTSAYTGKLTVSNGKQWDDFGQSVAISSNTIAVGATGVNSEAGAAYVFVEPTSGWTTMTQTAKLSASDGGAGDAFGYSVAIGGTSVLVGAGNAYLNSNPLQGSAYLYIKPSKGWISTSTYSAKFTAGDGSASAHFGRSVAAYSSTFAIGAYEGSNTGGALVGAAYVFGQ